MGGTVDQVWYPGTCWYGTIPDWCGTGTLADIIVTLPNNQHKPIMIQQQATND